MADKFINETGVAVIRDWVKGKFALDADLDSLSATVESLINEGGEPNTIDSITVNGTTVTPDVNKNVALTVPTITSELTNNGDGTSNFATENYVLTNGGKIDSIQVNGTAQTITNKIVNISVPTKVSELQNDGDGTSGSEFATKQYVQTEGGKIDSISVNNVAQTITNKNVNISVPTVVSDLTNDSGYQTESDVQTAIASGVASAVKIKGSVASYSALPSTGNIHGDMYDTLDTGKNYVWIVESGTGRWDDYAGTMDLSAYWISTSGQTNTLEAATVAEINAILNA